MIALNHSDEYPKLVIYESRSTLKKLWVEFEFIYGCRKYDDCLIVPLELPILELLLQYGCRPDSETAAWLEQQRDAETRLARPAMYDDVQLDHPKAALLYPYQRVGANFLVKRSRVVLADQQGLGKTAEAIIAVEISRWHDKVLIVCPKSLLGVWRDEIAKWAALHLPVTIVETRTQTSKITEYHAGWLACSYDTLRREDTIARISWDWVIADESQNLKNRATQNYRAVSSLKTRRIAFLTATPMGNGPHELWTMLHLIDPKRYSSYWRFRDLFCEYDPWEPHARVTDTRHPDLLRRELAPRMLQRKKADVQKQLPPKTVQRVPLGLNPKQEKHYDEMARYALVTLTSGDTLDALAPIAQLGRLRQILSTPATLGLADDSSKLDAAMDLIQSTDEKVVVFTLFRATVQALCSRLSREGVEHTYLWGGLTLDEIDAVKHRLDTDARVLVATLQTGGVGLTLTAASTCIFIDQHYNPEKQEQAQDRLHRISQTKPVTVYNLYCPNTVDDLVEEILQRKVLMTTAILGKALIEALQRRLP